MKNVTYINAGAGSGKTHRLTQTLTELIKDGKVRPEQVILTTFTTKAANEFKEKAKAFLFDNGMYEEAVQLDHAMIGTVHSVCERMIGKYWFNLGLSPNMGVMAEEDTKYYISQSLADLPKEEELKVLHDFAREFNVQKYEDSRSKGLDYDFWQGHLKSIIDYATNYELDDFKKSEDESLAYIRQFVNNESKCEFSYEELKAVVDEHEKFLRGYKQSATNDARIDKLVKARRKLSHPTIAILNDINSTIGTPKGYGPLADDFQNRMVNIWTSSIVCKKQEGYIKLLFSLALRWKENYAQFKRDKNLLDYNDMEKYMRLLMQDGTVASEIAQSYRYLFVDEFQDSSPIQVKIFDSLSDLMEHSYWVGDYKQAIYGFRGSDIALIKAVVDRVAKKENGCDTDTLDTSWRSLPDIVDVNNAVFEKTFANVLDKKNIHLKRHRENKTNEDSLRYFINQDDAGVAEHVLKLLKQGAKPNEIAVLARKNDTLSKVAENLKRWEIPSSRENYPVTESPVYPLVAALLRIVGSDKDTLSKATVAILTEEDCTTKQIIEAKIQNDTYESTKTEDYLADVPLISQLLTIRPRLQQQSIASLVESMVIELNLYDVVKKVDADSAFAISCLQTIINTARVYEEHCVQMNLPATIDGFLAYIEDVAPVGSGDPNGVQLHTYHSCKGLQWKYVILTSLNTNVSDINKSVKNETYGVHAVHTDEPSAENPYPEVYIRLTPWVYGTAKNMPNDISLKIKESDGFKLAYDSMLAETNRVFYVGMTRPQDVLILSIEEPKRTKLLQWPKDDGVDTAADNIPESGDWDVFGTGNLFKNFTMTPSEIGNLTPYGEVDESRKMALNIEEPSFERLAPRYLSPSKIHAMGDVASHKDFDKRIPFGKQPSDMADVGDCIHQIFAGIEEPRPAYKVEMDEIIGSYGLKAVLTDKNSIAEAWNNLADYLTQTHGKAVKTYHERPFRLERDGQTIVGSIDLVWQTAEGDILIDFKTCPMGPKAVLDSESDHYAGWYAGQLDAYEDALEAAGEKVLKRYIYYPVSGLLVEITRAFEVDPPYKVSIFHIFGVSGLNIEELWDTAPKYCSDDGYSGQVGVKESGENDDTCEEYSTMLQGASTQGVTVTYYPGERAHLHIDLPWLGSIGDVKLTFAFMKALRELFPECEIYYNDTYDEGQFGLQEENFEAMVVMLLRNMMNLIESSKNGQHGGAPGIFHDFIAPSLEDYPESSLEDLTMKAANDFIKLQWDYNDYEDAGLANARTPYGEEFTLRFLTNESNTFVGVCQHLAVSDNKDNVKDVLVDEFKQKMQNSPYFKMVDAYQFVLDKMPDDEWEKMYQSLDGQEMKSEPGHKTKTYLLRWNPAISSFTMDDYKEAVNKYPDGFQLNWSIYEWEEAHNGDRFYMLRVGEGNTGIVFHGEFLSEPYEGDDWAGKGKKRHYMDIGCLDATNPNDNPLISTEELQKAIPEIDWIKGHSGQLLTEEQTEMLDQLLSLKVSID